MPVKCETEGCEKIMREEDAQRCDCGMLLCRQCYASAAHDLCDVAGAADTVELPVMPLN